MTGVSKFRAAFETSELNVRQYVRGFAITDSRRTAKSRSHVVVITAHETKLTI